MAVGSTESSGQGSLDTNMQATFAQTKPGELHNQDRITSTVRKCSIIFNLRAACARQDSQDLQDWLNDGVTDQAQTVGDFSNEQVKASVSWPWAHQEIFQEAGFRHPPVLSLHYSDDELKALRAIPPRCREIVLYYDMKYGRIPKERSVGISQG